ncbi:hypothetical protein EVJ58_g10556, partial [Rhodofomes roseus]
MRPGSPSFADVTAGRQSPCIVPGGPPHPPQGGVNETTAPIDLESVPPTPTTVDHPASTGTPAHPESQPTPQTNPPATHATTVETQPPNADKGKTRADKGKKRADKGKNRADKGKDRAPDPPSTSQNLG